MADSRVKPLEWEEDDGFSRVETPIGSYRVTHYNDGGAEFDGYDFDTVEAAKAAAQTDYEQRILSALTSDMRDAEGQAVAWCQPNYGGKIHPRKFMVVYEDAEMGNAVFDDETEAREHFEKASITWNCYLFGLLPRSTPTPAPDAEAHKRGVEAAKKAYYREYDAGLGVEKAIAAYLEASGAVLCAEPVAWRWRWKDSPNWVLKINEPEAWPDIVYEPLYTRSPSQTEQGE